MYVYVCGTRVCGFLLGESHGASDRVVLDAGWDAREERAGVFAPMPTLIDCAD